MIVVLNMLIVTGLGIVQVESIGDRLTAINDVNSVKQRYAINFRGSVHDRVISFRDVSKVSTVIVTMSDYQTTIASAVEEQTATTAELNRSIAEAATGSEQVAESIGAVAAAARSTSESVDDSGQAAAELAEVSSRLEGSSGAFGSVRAPGPAVKLRRLGGARA